MSITIVVLSDGETWEELNDAQEILEVSDKEFEQLNNGELKPKSLNRETLEGLVNLESLWKYR